MKRKLKTILAIALTLMLALNGFALAGSAIVNDGSVTIDYSKRDLSGEWDAQDAVAITLSDSGSVSTGAGVSIDGSDITISTEGVYILTGTLSDGRVTVAATDNDKVQLVLNTASITCTTGPAIVITESDKAFITLAPDTINTVSDGATCDLTDDEPYAAIYSKADLTINGTGTLNVTGNYMHGITSKDDLMIVGCTLNVTSVEDGIRGKDLVAINGASITVNAGNDGIKSNNSEEADRGIVSIESGEVSITAECDGIQADNILQVNGGTLSIITGGGSANASTSDNSDWGNWGRGGFKGNVTTTTTDTEETASAKGLKSANETYINGGDITIDSSDDAIHGNGNVTVNGGDISVSSGDDGMHADSALTINGGSIDIIKSYEGIEGLTITINGGSIKLVSSDDGLNAAGGNDGSSLGRMGANPFDSNADAVITINGGTLVIDANGDGVDSNGALYVNGGVTLVSGPTNSGNGALDTGSTAKISGGIVVASGATGMAQNFGATELQASILAQVGSVQGGTAISVTDESGNVIVSYTPTKQYGCAVISAPALITGGTYTLSTGGIASNADENGFAQGGTLSGQTDISTFELSSAIMNVSSSGASEGGMGGFGGFGGFGGMGGGHRGRSDSTTDGTMVPPDGAERKMPGFDANSSATVRPDDNPSAESTESIEPGDRV